MQKQSKRRRNAVADLDGAEPAPPPPYGRLTDAITHGHARIFKMIATSGFLAALECTKFVFGRGSARDHTEELQRSSRPSIWFKGPYF